jgi:ribosomal protein L11 methylase PrmA
MHASELFPLRDPGSFRDPGGHVFQLGDRVVRAIYSAGMANYRSVEETGVLSELVEQGFLIPAREVSPQEIDYARLASPRGDVPCAAIEHPRIPLITYPYEWTFSQLKDAAVAHLDLQIFALDRNCVLTDATPYNMQFSDSGLFHIDVLSLRPYREGEYWVGYNQFCRLFLVPLLIEAWTGVPFQPFLKGSLDGMKLSDAQYLLPKTKRLLSLNGLLHITIHAGSERANSSSTLKATDKAARSLPRRRYRAMLTEMRAWINGLESGRKSKSFWNEYSTTNSYTDHMRDVKRAFVAKFARDHDVISLWDIGGNMGDFSAVALAEGTRHAVVIDTDLDSLEAAYVRRKRDGLHLLPLVMDCADPSACAGWNQEERKGLHQRANADASLALAVVHHLCVGRNIPLQEVVEWLVSLAPRGVVEFVPKEDPMVQQMLALRDVEFSDYHETAFREYVGQVGRITAEHRFSENGRLLISYERSR